MDNRMYNDNEAYPIIGIPYENINWEDIPEQPFGLASRFNLFVLGDANNIVDVEGAVAVGGSFYSPRSLSIGFQRKNAQVPVELSSDLVRYLVGNILSMGGPLGVIGHVVVGGNSRVGNGSTYYIENDNTPDQAEELKQLYQANGGSPYWNPVNKGDYYIISSYDVSRVIPATRISANVSRFFRDAANSMKAFKSCIEELPENGTVTSNSYEWILTGNDPKQNIFTIDVRPNGLLNKGIRFDIPEGSTAVVRLRTGPHAHLQYGVYGDEALANRTLYVFEDATNIHMEKSSDIWGSILAPSAMFHGHSTGGHVSGNAALGGFAVNANSGFEFHLYPFIGGINCHSEREETPTPVAPAPEESGVSPITQPAPTCPTPPPCPTCPAPVPCPEEVICPPAPPCPAPIPCPQAPPCPACPVPMPCPTCPEPIPVTCPECPEVRPCPTCPVPRPCPACPEPIPCPTCPTCPACPEPIPVVCPTCPVCPEQQTEYIAVPIPIPVQSEEEVQICPTCDECLIIPGLIVGCVSGCDCRRDHEWDVMLYMMVDGRMRLIYCKTICHLGCFYFEVDYEESYVLRICPAKKSCFLPTCRPEITLKNVGVANLTIE